MPYRLQLEQITDCTVDRMELISKVLPSGFASDRTPATEELKKLIGDDLRFKVIICIVTRLLRHKSRSMELSEGEHQNQGEKISVEFPSVSTRRTKRGEVLNQ